MYCDLTTGGLIVYVLNIFLGSRNRLVMLIRDPKRGRLKRTTPRFVELFPQIA
jgi:hypothetical protein